MFDEAQRAWNREQTTKFMRQKEGPRVFDQSDRNSVVVIDRHPIRGRGRLLGRGGQENQTLARAGISEWMLR